MKKCICWNIDNRTDQRPKTGNVKSSQAYLSVARDKYCKDEILTILEEIYICMATPGQRHVYIVELYLNTASEVDDVIHNR